MDKSPLFEQTDYMVCRRKDDLQNNVYRREKEKIYTGGRLGQNPKKA